MTLAEFFDTYCTNSTREEKIALIEHLALIRFKKTMALADYWQASQSGSSMEQAAGTGAGPDPAAVGDVPPQSRPSLR